MYLCKPFLFKRIKFLINYLQLVIIHLNLLWRPRAWHGITITLIKINIYNQGLRGRETVCVFFFFYKNAVKAGVKIRPQLVYRSIKIEFVHIIPRSKNSRAKNQIRFWNFWGPRRVLTFKNFLKLDLFITSAKKIFDKYKINAH